MEDEGSWSLALAATVAKVAYLRRCHLSKELEAGDVGTSTGEHSRYRGQ